MILKFNRKSRGSKGVVEYLLNHRAGEGTAVTLRGNPKITQSLIKHIKRKHKYLSGGLFFAKDEIINDEQTNQIIDSFEKLLFAGIDRDKYNILWVLHTDKSRIELNFVVPRIELSSGNDLDLYSHRRDLPLMDMWKNGINAKYNLIDPNDPRRERTMKERTRHARGAGSIVANRKNLDKTLHQLVQKGEIKSRIQMIELLQKSGYKITRKNSESISVKHQDIGKKALKLKGGIYHENFASIGSLKSISEEREQRVREYDHKVARGKTSPDRDTYQRYLQTRIEHNQKRYPRPEQTHKRKPQLTHEGDSNDLARKNHDEAERIAYDRVRKHAQEARRRREKRMERAREREVDFFKQIKIYNRGISKRAREAEQVLLISIENATVKVGEYIKKLTRGMDEQIIKTDEQIRRNRSTITNIFDRANGQINQLTKSIKGVANEIKKMRLFSKAKREVFQKKPTIKRNLTP